MIDAVTWWDVFGSLRAVVSFAALLLAPGYCLAWAVNLLDFRTRALSERLAWSTALSFGAITILSVELAKYASLSAVCWLAALCAAGFLWLMGRELWARPGLWSSRTGRIAIALAFAWTIFAIAELVDLGIGNRLYFSVTVYDHALRTAFVDSVLHTGVPPANPLFWPGHAAPMRYYYFWYVLTAVAARLGAATARQAMIASAVWSGFGLAAITALYCRHFLSPDLRPATARRWPRLAIALTVLAVAGLDILPVIVKFMLRLPTDGDMDWWSAAQVTTWMASMLWVPHHVAGLICCLFGFLLVWLAKERTTLQRCLCALIAGISFASAFGLSTWVALACAIVLLAWLLWSLLWESDSRRRLPVLIGAGLVAAMAAMPYVLELRKASSGSDSSVSGNAAGLLHFGIRHIIESDILLLFPWFSRLAHLHPRFEEAVASLLLLFPGYFTELGFFGLVLLAAILAARRRNCGEGERTALMLACAGLVVATFLRSSLITSNDFGFRSMLIPQFFLLLLAARWFETGFGPPRLHGAMRTMLWIGIAGTVYQAIELRTYLPAEESLHRPLEDGLSEQAMALRRAFDAMNQRIPPNAVVQYDPQQHGDYFQFARILQVRRQVATAYPKCNIAFGGDPQTCAPVERGIARLFSASRVLTGSQAQLTCSALGIDDLIATRWDPVWLDRGSWVWSLPVVLDTGDVRVVSCTR